MDIDKVALAAPAQPAAIPRATFLSLPFSGLTFEQVATLLAARPPENGFIYVATPNAQHATEYHRGNPDFVSGLADATLLTCDSRILRSLARRLFGIDLPLVTGSDLTRHLFESVIRPDDAITVIGGDAAMAEALRRKYSLARLAQHVPPFGFSHDNAELQRCAAFARAHAARFVFIACGAPQSEVLGAYLTRQKGITGIGLCIGASLMFITGQRKRAPLVLQRCGLEWLHRLLQEPGRMGPRFLQRQLPVLGIAIAARLAARGAGSDRTNRIAP